MLKVGDWISIPRRDIDGIVDDITLNTVKVQNFDKTIITIPTYSLVNDSFQNWRGMEESGIRQVKRSIFIDMKSIRFLDKEMKERLCRVPELKEFIKSGEIKKDSTRTRMLKTVILLFSILHKLRIWGYSGFMLNHT